MIKKMATLLTSLLLFWGCSDTDDAHVEVTTLTMEKGTLKLHLSDPLIELDTNSTVSLKKVLDNKEVTITYGLSNQKPFQSVPLVVESSVRTASTDPTVIVKASTKSYNGEYAPANAGAMWITKSGEYVRTIRVFARSYIRFVLQWQKSAGKKDIDGVTTASRYDHGEIEETPWDLKDKAGKTVSDGEYTLWFEFTEDNGQGKVDSLPFTINSSLSDPVTVSAKPQDYLPKLSITYTPSSSEPSTEEKSSPFTVGETYILSYHIMGAVALTDNKTVKSESVDTEGTITFRVEGSKENYSITILD